jgi:hypothetical protein
VMSFRICFSFEERAVGMTVRPDFKGYMRSVNSPIAEGPPGGGPSWFGFSEAGQFPWCTSA